MPQSEITLYWSTYVYMYSKPSDIRFGKIRDAPDYPYFGGVEMGGFHPPSDHVDTGFERISECWFRIFNAFSNIHRFRASRELRVFPGLRISGRYSYKRVFLYSSSSEIGIGLFETAPISATSGRSVWGGSPTPLTTLTSDLNRSR